jgi:hypothetical protein
VSCAVWFLNVFVKIITMLTRNKAGDVLMMKYGTIILSMLLVQNRGRERGRLGLKYKAQFILQ